MVDLKKLKEKLVEKLEQPINGDQYGVSCYHLSIDQNGVGTLSEKGLFIIYAENKVDVRAKLEVITETYFTETKEVICLIPFNWFEYLKHSRGYRYKTKDLKKKFEVKRLAIYPQLAMTLVDFNKKKEIYNLSKKKLCAILPVVTSFNNELEEDTLLELSASLLHESLTRELFTIEHPNYHTVSFEYPSSWWQMLKERLGIQRKTYQGQDDIPPYSWLDKLKEKFRVRTKYKNIEVGLETDNLPALPSNRWVEPGSIVYKTWIS